MLKPFAHRPRPAGIAVETVVLHATAGRESPASSVANAEATLRRRGLGYHYLIARDGTVYKGCPVSMRTGHAGSSYGPRQAALGISRAQRRDGTFVVGCSVNDDSIGIALVNDNVGQPYPPAQVAATRDLVATLRRAMPGLRWVTAHYEVSPHRKTDPAGLDLEAVAAGLAVWRHSM